MLHICESSSCYIISCLQQFYLVFCLYLKMYSEIFSIAHCPKMGFEDALLKGLYKTRKTVLLCSMDLGRDKSGTVPSGGVCH